MNPQNLSGHVVSTKAKRKRKQKSKQVEKEEIAAVQSTNQTNQEPVPLPLMNSGQVMVNSATASTEQCSTDQPATGHYKDTKKLSVQTQRTSLKEVTPHSFVVSKVNNVSSSPWISAEEFLAVYNWLYSSKTESIRKGVARVAAWNTRGTVPIGIEVTACLCEAVLMESKHNAGNCFQTISFGYSMAIAR